MASVISASPSCASAGLVRPLAGPIPSFSSSSSGTGQIRGFVNDTEKKCCVVVSSSSSGISGSCSSSRNSNSSSVPLMHRRRRCRRRCRSVLVEAVAASRAEEARLTRDTGTYGCRWNVGIVGGHGATLLDGSSSRSRTTHVRSRRIIRSRDDPAAVVRRLSAASSSSSSSDAATADDVDVDGVPIISVSDGLSIDRTSELSSVFKFAVPLLATNIVTPLLTMTDTAFVGRCAANSVVQLAALGVSTPLTDYTVTLAAFIPAGLTNIISNGVARGESKESLASKTYGALFISLTLSLAIAAVLNIFPETLLGWLQTPQSVMTAAVEYVRIRSIGMPAAYLTAAAYAVLVARKDTTSPLACVCLAAAVNVVGDWLAVAVLGGGAAGAAWATTAALYAGCVAILVVLKKQGYVDDFPWGTLKWKEQLAPVMAFAGPITFLVFALLSIYTALILFANSLGVTVSAAHRIAGNVFAVAVLCGDPLIQAGQAFMPRYLLPEVPRRQAARQMAGLLQTIGWGTGFFASFCCGLACVFGGGLFTRDAAVVEQLRAVAIPVCAAVITNIVSKSMYGVTVAAKQLGFLAAITGGGLVFFGTSLWYFDKHLTGPDLYFWMWWVVMGYYALAIAAIQIKSFGIPGVIRGMFHDSCDADSAQADNCEVTFDDDGGTGGVKEEEGNGNDDNTEGGAARAAEA